MIQSNETQAVAVLAMALFWNTNVNSHLHLQSDKELRDDALMIFKKFQIYGDMTQDEFNRMRYYQDEDENDEYPELDEVVDDEDDEEELDDDDVYPELDEDVDDEDDEEDDEEGLDDDEGKGYHILNFYLDCSYCHRQENEIKKCPIIIPVQIVSVDEDDDIVSKYEVNNLPTLILVDGNGKEIHRWVGVTPTSEINDYITKNGYGVIENDESDYDKNEAHIRSKIRKGLEEHMAKTMQKHGDLMNDPFTGGLMVEAAIGSYFQALRKQNVLYVIASHFGVNLDDVLDEESSRALSRYLK